MRPELSPTLGLPSPETITSAAFFACWFCGIAMVGHARAADETLLPYTNSEITLDAQPWPLRPGPRSITVQIYYPGGKKSQVAEHTGLMLTLHNWGGTGASGTADPQTLADQLQVVAISLDYLHSGKQGDNTRPYDFGYLQSLDALRALHHVYDGLQREKISFEPSRIFATGGSGGGNVSLMCNKLAPRTFACIVDMCGMAKLSDDIAFNRPGGSSLDAGYSSDPKSERYLSPDAQALRFVGHPRHLAKMKELGNRAKVIVVHGQDDHTCPIEDAREMVENMRSAGLDVSAHFISRDNLDGKVLTSSGHPLGNRTEIVLRYGRQSLSSKARQTTPDNSTDFAGTDFEYRDRQVFYDTPGGQFVISYEAGYPVGSFEPSLTP